MIVKFQIKVYPYIGGTGVWSSSPTTINDAYDTSVSLGIGDTKDVFEFKLPNYRNANIGLYNGQDRVEIYLLINDATADTVNGSNLLMNGVIKKVTEDVNDKGRALRIEGTSFSEIITNALVFYDTGTTHTLDVMELLNACLLSIENFDRNFNISWDNTNPTQKYNPVSKAYDGGAYPLVDNGEQIREYYKSFNSVLDKYLQDSYTGDGRYYYYVRNTTPSNAVLSIRKRTADFDAAITEGVDFYNAKYAIDNSEVRNFIVVKCGYDPANKPITTRYDNIVSRAKHGFKYYMLIDHNIAGELMNKERLLYPSRYTESSNFPNSYASYTTSWGVSVSSNETFVSAFIAEAKRLGKDRGKAFSTLYENGLIKVTVETVPTLDYNLGSKYSLTAPSYDLTNKLVRLSDITWSEERTSITFEEEVTI
jgi:hypothetical protein